MCADRVRLKDRILEGVSKAVKEVQAFSCEQGSELLAVKNDDRPLQKLVECLDHALLHGLRHITPGYWALVKKFTHKDIIQDIFKLDRLATDLGRSRAWLYQALNDTALESYIRCFLENKATTRKFYVENALMRDKERLVLLQTLVSGLDFVTFDLQLNIAYFDLVSHIPRSASIDADNEDQMSVHSWDDNSSIASALSGGFIADVDEISLASTPGDQGDKGIKSSWLTSPEGVTTETWSNQEKRHSSPHILADTDTIDDLPSCTSEQHSTDPLKRSMSDVPTASFHTEDVLQKATRPASLATVSRIERLSNMPTAHVEQNGINANEEDLLVIRLKGKKGKKGKKKKAKSLSQGNTPIYPVGLGFAPQEEEDTASLEFDDDRTSKSSSFSSQGTSDKSSVLDLSMQSTLNPDVQQGSSPASSDVERKVNEEQNKDQIVAAPSVLNETEAGVSPLDEVEDNDDDSVLKKHPSDLDSEVNLQTTNTKSDSDGQNQNVELEADNRKIVQEKNLDKENENVLPQENVQSESLTSQISTNEPRKLDLTKTNSLDYDTTIEYSLTSVVDSPVEMKSSYQLSQVQLFESSLDDSLLANLSMDDPGYTNLLLTHSVPAGLVPTAEQSESDQSASSGQGSAFTGHELLQTSGESPIEDEANAGDYSKGTESEDLSPIGERTSPEGIDSSKVIGIGMGNASDCEADKNSVTEAEEVTAELQVDSYREEKTDDINNKASGQGNEGIVTHPAEIIVDNNAKLYLMLEIFKNEHEEFKKLVRMSTGHSEGDLEPLFVLLTDQAIYLLRRGERLHRYITETRIVFNDLDYISVGMNYQTIQLVCANRRNQFWLNTGDEQLSRYFLQELVLAMEGGSRTRDAPSILTDATTQLISMQKFAARECRMEMQDTKVHLYSLVHWEDLVDSAQAADMQLYQPMVIKEGRLQFKANGSFLTGSYWKDAFFMIRNDTFYRFGYKKDKDPQLAVQLRTQHFGGCRRVRCGERPYCFELILQDGTSLEIACKNETDVSNWLQAICRVVAQGMMRQHKGKTHSPCQPCCSIIAQNKVLICHEDCQTNFYRCLASCNITDISSIAVDQHVQEYVILEFQSPDNPWVVYFNCLQEKDKFLRTLSTIWKQRFQVDLPVHDMEDQKVQKRCRECLTLIQSAWQRCDSLTRGRIGGNIW
ncbi:LOW QUALITY PROTEIN: pleckstrin homology domain-containing family M member 2-like [Amphiura filiformis]|uniref:LOW QUALITY PROTEIN: pleckstrin homology domain-containing family M member 2-like n=1 Tax=Amphiura filiformis TaxID=82378 RepID=UPI003B2106A7